MKAALSGLVLIASACPALAQTVTTKPTIGNPQPTVTAMPVPQEATIKNLLADNFEIRTGFIDPNGGAYLVLQKATSAYLCHSNPNPTCEKLN
jgi:type V secretory pathway adhesin AidA